MAYFSYVAIMNTGCVHGSLTATRPDHGQVTLASRQSGKKNDMCSLPLTIYWPKLITSHPPCAQRERRMEITDDSPITFMVPSMRGTALRTVWLNGMGLLP